MHNPTAAEKKIILAALPPAPAGKKWQQYKANEKIGEGHFISFRNGGVERSSPNAGVIGYMGSELASDNSSWKLVRDRKKVAPPAPAQVKYVVSASLGTFADCAFLRVNLDGSATRVFKDGSERKYSFPSCIENSIKYGSWKYIPEAQALALLPRKIRYFASRTSFKDNTAYLRHDGDPSKNATLVRTDGSERADSYISLAGGVGNCKDAWKEITESEAKALLTPPKTELELVKEKLAAAESRIKSLEVTNSELNRKIASAKATLS